MNTEPYYLLLPRQEFMAWLIAIASNKFAGVGEITMTFQMGNLTLNCEWGETSMNYEGKFNGVVVFRSQTLFALVRRYASKQKLSTPLRAIVDVTEAKFILEAVSAKALIKPSDMPPVIPTDEPQCANSEAMRFTLATNEFISLLKRAIPHPPSKKTALKLTALNGRLYLLCGHDSANMELAIASHGEVTVSAKTFRQVLASYQGTPTIEFEASKDGLRLNAFRMSVSNWSGSPQRPTG